MRVVQLLPELHEGGVERGVVEMNREFVQKGVESFVISAGGKLEEQIIKDGGVHMRFDVCSKNPLTAPLRTAGLKKIFGQIQPDIIHARSRVPAWLSYFARGDIPFVTTVHGFNSVNPYSAIMTKGERVICVSNPVKKYICQNYAIDEAKIRVIHRGVDLEKFDLQKIDKSFIATFKEQYDLQNKFIITSVGRITQLKDYETFIEAIALLKEQKPNVRGLIVGGVRKDKEEYFKKLQDLVKRLGVEENIIFTGSIAKVSEIYALSDVVVSSSKKPESFGRSIAEAMAMNTPVVATAHGGALDICKEGFGELFSPGDARELAQKILHVKKRSDLREYVAKNFSLQQMVEKTLAVYEELL
ncbi:glycosyltransferase family 4 protein [Nitratiruptor tergarcus]|uniref:Glycosyltransferase involved in cell wall bisynthesis n=1 Tax=Nitratiruptor tergarcus DSM 16512 TaxID=1069081 RepID=A0A1W1WVA3_9BACT|nr:glycosyltransferase family 4 protein [Nitratiruptor tergarcus]SMC10145.1 Glycosyltransferase involved in cell wall bisynthesis [Nitratiruptor tergarcus DSM 16512]